MNASDTQTLHETLCNQIGPTCRADDCGDTATKVRHWPNPIWGYDFPTKTGTTPDLSETDFLLCVKLLAQNPQHEDVPFPLDHVRTLCQTHFDATLPKPSGETVGQLDQFGDPGAGPSEAVHARTKRYRSQVLELLGQECSRCTRQRQAKSLEVRLLPEVEPSFWASHGLSSWADKYAFLADPEVDPKTLVEAVCRFCAGSRVSESASPAKQNLRVRVVTGYGGKCGVCLEEVSARVAWVVRKPGFEQLRHGGGSGRKLTSKQKYEKLLSLGCPPSHELRCPEHRDTDSPTN